MAPAGTDLPPKSFESHDVPLINRHFEKELVLSSPREATGKDPDALLTQYATVSFEQAIDTCGDLLLMLEFKRETRK